MEGNSQRRGNMMRQTNEMSFKGKYENITVNLCSTARKKWAFFAQALRKMQMNYAVYV